MADHFTHFSCLIDVGSPDKAVRARALFKTLRTADQDADDPEVSGLTLLRQDASGRGDRGRDHRQRVHLHGAGRWFG